MTTDSFKTRGSLQAGGKTYEVFSLDVLARSHPAVRQLPFSLRVLLENLLRHEDGRVVKREHIEKMLAWSPKAAPETEISFHVARVLLQDFTGVPAVVDLAGMREALAALGGDPNKINPRNPADLVIDHSVVVDQFGSIQAFQANADLEFDRNRERYAFLRWGQGAFRNFRVVPPDTGICHQVNLEFLAQVAFSDGTRLYPDTLVGTDSHTTMVNGLGVVGWGVGGIEAEAALLGQPLTMLIPQVVGFRLIGKLPPGATATDLVLTVTQMLRKKGVVGKFVEFFGPGIGELSLPDRATIANMAPEYGATIGFFPVDAQTLAYLRFTGRPAAQVEVVEAYCKAQGLLHTAETPEPVFSDLLSLDLGTVEPSLAGPKRPQDRVPLKDAKKIFQKSLLDMVNTAPPQDEDAAPASAKPAQPVSGASKLSASAVVNQGTLSYRLQHGAVVIAAITSCTNTSNPAVLLAAGLLAKKAVERGLGTKPWVKTSLAPGSKVVMDYLRSAGLVPYLEALGFHLVGYGCTTCIGNSGPLPEHIASAVTEQDLIVAAVLSGNRNFEGRINPFVRMNFLASPPLVVAYALAGEMDIDLVTEPLAVDRNGSPVYLKDIWPSDQEIREAVAAHVKPEQFRNQYAHALEGDARWQKLQVPTSNTFAWDEKSTYVRRPPVLREPAEGAGRGAGHQERARARPARRLGDHRPHQPRGKHRQGEPGGALPDGAGRRAEGLQLVRKPPRQPRGDGARYVRQHPPAEPARPGGVEGGVTVHHPTRERMSIYDAAMKYAAEKTPLVVIAGAEYGTGSSRDWAAKGTLLLGVRAVLAKSFERIHRSNLVGMGVLPLQFDAGVDAATLGLTGKETFEVLGVAEGLAPGKRLTVKATGEQGSEGVQRDLPHRYAERARLLPQRRHPAVRPPPAGEGVKRRSI